MEAGEGGPTIRPEDLLVAQRGVVRIALRFLHLRMPAGISSPAPPGIPAGEFALFCLHGNNSPAQVLCMFSCSCDLAMPGWLHGLLMQKPGVIMGLHGELGLAMSRGQLGPASRNGGVYSGHLGPALPWRLPNCVALEKFSSF